VLEDADAQDGVEERVGERELLKLAAREPDRQSRKEGRLVEPVGVAEALAVRVAADDVEPGRREQEREECQPRPRVEQAAARGREIRPCVWVLPLAAEVAECVGRNGEVGPPDAPRRGEELDLEALERGDDLRVGRVLEVCEQRVAVARKQAVGARWEPAGQFGDRPSRPVA
jgi:hypothetical protein